MLISICIYHFLWTFDLSSSSLFKLTRVLKSSPSWTFFTSSMWRRKRVNCFNKFWRCKLLWADFVQRSSNCVSKFVLQVNIVSIPKRHLKKSTFNTYDQYSLKTYLHLYSTSKNWEILLLVFLVALKCLGLSGRQSGILDHIPVHNKHMESFL